MSLSNTQSQSTKQRQPSRNLRSPKNAAELPAASPATAQAETEINPATVADPTVRYVGLDVHKKQITYCILDRDGVTLREGEIMLTRERLTHFAKDILQPTDRVALESTTNCWAVVQHLQPHVPNVVVSNPMATKAIAHSKIKTDKVDAKVLAQLLRCDFLPTVWQPDEATRLRRQLTGRRASLVGQRTQLQNRIHSVLAMRLIIPPGDYALFGTRGLAWLKTLTEETIDLDGLMMIESDLRLLENLQAEIDVFDLRLARLAYDDERVKLSDDNSRREHCRGPGFGRRLRRHHAFRVRRFGRELSRTDSFDATIRQHRVPWSDHQTRQLNGADDARTGRAAILTTGRSAGPFLPASETPQVSQCGRGGDGSQTGDHCLATADDW